MQSRDGNRYIGIMKKQSEGACRILTAERVNLIRIFYYFMSFSPRKGGGIHSVRCCKYFVQKIIKDMFFIPAP